MIKKILFISLICAFVYQSSLGLAQSTDEEEVESTTYDFDDDLVTGDLVRPDGELLNVRRRGRGSSLIRIREHFIPEILKSVEDL